MNPFMTLAFCSKMAARNAYRTGTVTHVIATWDPERPLEVIDDHTLFERRDRIEVGDLLFTADPFAEIRAGTS